MFVLLSSGPVVNADLWIGVPTAYRSQAYCSAKLWPTSLGHSGASSRELTQIAWWWQQFLHTQRSGGAAEEVQLKKLD